MVWLKSRETLGNDGLPKLMGNKIAKIGIFGMNLPKRVYPLSDFYQIWHDGGTPRFAPSCQISPLWLEKFGPPKKNHKNMVIFLYKFAPKGKFWGPQKKLNTGAQLQTFLYGMTL